jgi:hypothetical protein
MINEPCPFVPVQMSNASFPPMDCSDLHIKASDITISFRV